MPGTPEGGHPTPDEEIIADELMTPEQKDMSAYRGEWINKTEISDPEALREIGRLQLVERKTELGGGQSHDGSNYPTRDAQKITLSGTLGEHTIELTKYIETGSRSDSTSAVIDGVYTDEKTAERLFQRYYPVRKAMKNEQDKIEEIGPIVQKVGSDGEVSVGHLSPKERLKQIKDKMPEILADLP